MNEARLIRVELGNIWLVIEKACESSSQKLLAGVSICKTLDVHFWLMVMFGKDLGKLVLRHYETLFMRVHLPPVTCKWLAVSYRLS